MQVTGISEATREGAVLPLLGADLARYQGEVCFSPGCGVTEGLADAGLEYTLGGDGSRHGWPVKTCPDHVRGRR